MAPSHVRVAARLHVKQLTGENAGQPLSSEITYPRRRPCGPRGKAILRSGANQRVVSRSAESETLSMRGNSMIENREISIVSAVTHTDRAAGEGLWSKPGMNAVEKSDIGVVPKKEPNNVEPFQRRRLQREGR